MELAAINWLATLVGAVAAFLLGWLIYSPILFIKQWAEGSGVDLENGSGPPVFAMIAQIVALLLLATVVGITATGDALITAILAILAAAAFAVSNGAFCHKSTFAMAVDGGYVVAAGVVMILVQGLL
jgi:hypothetical protein